MIIESENQMMAIGRELGRHVKSEILENYVIFLEGCLLYTSPSPRDRTRSRMPSSA